MQKIFGKLGKIYSNEKVSEIIVDRFDDVYWEENGKIEESSELFKNEEEISEIIENILDSVGRNRDSMLDGFADLRLADGTRVAITTAPISLNGPSLVIRKMHTHRTTVENLIDWGAISKEGWTICESLVKKGKNVLLAGNAGCGKTTLLNVLTSAIDPAWRVVTVEKTAEMDPGERKRTLRLETANSQQTEMKELVQKAGLLRADTIVVNELMGSEAFNTINLMREGYSVMATVMAEGVFDALKKVEIFCMMDQFNLGSNEIKYHVCSGVDVVIYQERLPSGKRVLSNISLVEGVDELNNPITKPLYTYDEETGEFFVTPEGKKYL